MPWDLLKPVIEYLSKQSFQNTMMAVLIGVIVYFNVERNKQTKESHDMVHEVFKEIRTESQQNQDRLVDAMLGVKREIKANTAEAARTTAEVSKIPEAAAVAADKIVKKAAEDKGEQ